MSHLRDYRRFLGTLMFVLMLSWQVGQPLQAATFYWDADANSVNGAQDGGGIWTPASTVTLYNGSTEVAGTTTDIVQFGNGGTLASPASILITTGTVGGLVFGATATSGYSLVGSSSGQVLTLGTSGIMMNAGAQATTIGNSATLSLVLGGAQTWNNASASLLTIAGGIDNGANLLTVGGFGTGGTAITGVIGTGGTVSGGLTTFGTSTVTLSKANLYTGSTTVGTGSTLKLDFSASGAPATNIVNSSTNTSDLKLSGGTLNLTGVAAGANSQRFNGVTVNSGAAAFTATQNGATSLSASLGTIVHNTGGTLNFTLPTTGSVTLSNSNDASGILGPWALVAGNAYATVTGGAVVAYTGATAATANLANVSSATTNYTFAAAATLAGSATANTLQYTGATATLALGSGSNVLTLNGLLNTSGAVLTITGTGTTSIAIGATNELVIAGPNSVTISSAISGSSKNLTYSGASTLTLNTTASTYTGTTTVNSGTMTLALANVLNINSSIVINGGTLGQTTFAQSVAGVSLRNGSLTGTTGLLTSASAFDLQNGSVTAAFAGSAGADKTTAGTVTITNTTASTMTGGFRIKNGTLVANSATPLGSAANPVTLGDSSAAGSSASLLGGGFTIANPITLGTGAVGMLTIGNSGTTVTTTLTGAVTMNGNPLTLSNSGTTGSTTLTGGFLGIGSLTLNNIATGTTAGALTLSTSSVNNTGSITNSGIGAGASVISAAIGTNVTGVTQNSATSLLVLTGANTYTGATAVNFGTLNLGTGGSLAGTSVTAAAGTTLVVNGSTNNTIGTSGSASVTITGGTGATGAILTMVGGGLSSLNINSATAGATVLTMAGTAGNASTLIMDIGGAGSDTITLGSGLVTSIGAGGVTLTLNPGSVLTAGDRTLLTTPGGGLTAGGSQFTLDTNWGGAQLSLGKTTSSALILSVNNVNATPLFAWFKGSLDGNWNTFTSSGLNYSNWTTLSSGLIDTNAMPGATTAVHFSALNATTGNLSTSLNGATPSIASLTLDGDLTNAVTISPGVPVQTGSLTIGSGGITIAGGAAGALTVSAPVVLGATQTWTNRGASALTVSGALSGTGNLLLNANAAGAITVGTGTVGLTAGTVGITGSITNLGTGTGLVTISGALGSTVSGIVQNSTTSQLTLSGLNTAYTGGINIKSGTVSGTQLSSFGSTASTIFIGDSTGSANATLSAGITGTFTANPISIVSGNTGIATITASTATPVLPGAVTLNSHDLQLLGAASAFTLSGAVSGTGNIVINANGSGVITLGTGSITMVGTITNSGTGTATNVLSGVLAVGGVTKVIQNSATSQLTMSGANTAYVNGVTIKAGTLAGTVLTTFGTTASTITIGDSAGSANATAAFNLTGAWTANPISVASGNTGVATITASGASPTVAGAITLNSHDLQVLNAATTLWTLSGAISSTGTGGSLVLNGNSAGGLTLSNASINPVGSITNSGTGAGTTTISGVMGTNVTSLTENSFTSALTLSGANTFTGTTTINQGVINLTTANGKLTGTTSVAVTGAGTLNIGDAVAGNGVVNRINTAATLTLGGTNGGGNLAIIRTATTANSQSLVSLTIGTGISSISATTGGGAPTLTFSGATPYVRNVGGLVNIDITNQTTTFTNAPTASNIAGTVGTGNPILLGAILSGNDFVKAASGNLAATTYTANTWATGNNTQVTTSSAPTSGSNTQSLAFSTGANTITLSGTNTIDSGGILVQTAATSGSITGGSLQSASGQDLWIYLNGKPLTISSSIIDNSGSSLTLGGTSTLTLSGANAYAGTTTIGNGATLILSSSGTAIAGNISLGGHGAATLTLGASNQIADTSVITFNSGTTLATGSIFSLATFSETVAGVQTAANAPGTGSSITGTGGTLSLAGAGSYVYDGSITGTLGLTVGTGAATNFTLANTAAAANTSYTGATTIGSGATLTLIDSGNGATIGSFASAITNNGALVLTNTSAATSETLAKVISGGGTMTINAGTSTIVLSQTNLYTGGLTIKSGTLSGTNLAAFGTTASTITIGDSSGSANATLSYGLTGTWTANPISIAAGNTGTATITASTPTPTMAGAITLNSHDLQLLGTASNLTLSGGITGTGNVSVNSTGAGTVGLSAGTLNFTGNLTYNGNSTGGETTGAAVSIVGSVTNSGTGTNTTTINGVIGTTVTGVIQNSATSALTLSGTNTFTSGLSINNGTAILNNASGAGTAAITLGATGGSNNAALVANTFTIANQINLGTTTGTLTLGNNGTTVAAVFSGLISLNGHDLNIAAGSPTLGTTGTTTVSGDIAGTGNLILLNNNTGATAGGITLSSVSLNNVGTITNAGVGAGAATISTVIGSNVTGIIQNSGTSQLNLTAANTYTVNTTISSGVLALTGTASLGGTAISIAAGGTLLSAGTTNAIGTGGSPSITIAGAAGGSGGTLSLLSGGINALTINSATSGATVLTMLGASGNAANLNLDVSGATADTITLGAGLLTSIGAGGVNLNLTTIGTLTTGSRTLLTSPGGGLTAGGSQFTLSGNWGGAQLDLSSTTATALILNVSSVNATPGTAYFKGGIDVNWNTFTGGSANNSNWFTDAAGTTDANQMPGSTTDVHFYTTNATLSNLATSLNGAQLTIKSLTMDGGALSNAVTIAPGSGGTLTITPTIPSTGITLSTGSGNLTISAPLVLGASQTWTVATGAGVLAVSGGVSGTANLTIAGSGITAFSGTNTYVGTTTVSGILRADSTSGFNSASAFTINAGGTLRINGFSNTILSLTGAAGSIVENNTATAATLTVGDSNNTAYSGILQNGSTGTLGLTKVGVGALTLSGANTYTGNTTVSAGTLNITGSYSGAASVLNYGASAANSIVNVSGNMTLTSTAGASVAGAVAVYNQTAGTVTVSVGDTNTNNTVASAGYGYFNLTGGTYNLGTGRFNVTSGAGTGVVYVGNSTLNATGTYFLVGYNGTNALGEVTVGPGGSIIHDGASQAFGLFWASATETGVLNVAGGTVSTTTKAFTFGGGTGATNNTGFINLAAGTLSTGVAMAVNGGTGSNAYLNFAGGTIKTSAAVTALIPLTASNVTVTSTIFGAINNNAATGDATQNFTGGLTFDTNSFNSSLTNVLKAASGVGVTQTDLTVTGGTGYIGAPAVVFSTTGLVAGGAPASGYAIISGGAVTGIVITSPGTYTAGTIPTITLTGGGGSGASVTAGALNTANVSGGLTKIGAGTLTLSGANTFSGAVSITAGTLSISSSGNLGDASATNTLSLAGGTLQNTGSSVALGTTRTVALGTGGGTFDVTSANSLTVDGAISGSTTLTKSNTGTLVLSGTNTGFSGAVSITGGTLSIAASNNLGDASATNTLSLTGSTLAFTGATVDLGSTRTVALGTGGGTFNVTGTQLTVSGVVSGANSLTKTGAGILVLSNTSNTNSGAVTVNGGTLSVHPSAITAATGAVTIGSTTSSTLDFYAVPGVASLNLAANTNLVLGGASSSGALGFQLGATTTPGTTYEQLVLSGTSTLTAAAGGGLISAQALSGFGVGTYTIITGPNAITGAANLGTGILPAGFGYSINTATAGQVKLVVSAAAATMYWAGDISSSWNTVNSGGAATNWSTSAAGITPDAASTPGTGTTVNFSATGAANFTTTLDAAFSIAGLNFTSTGSAVTIAPGLGGTLQIGSGGISVATLAPTGSVISAPVILGANNVWTVTDAATTLTVSGIVSETGGARTLGKAGSGTLVLSGANSYTGAVSITAGVLNIQNNTALGTIAGGVTVSSGAALQLQGNLTIGAEALSLNGTGVSTTGALRNISGNTTYAGLVTLAGATRINSDSGLLTLSNAGTITGAFSLTVGGLGNTTINSVIGTAAGTLVKDGIGTLTLTGTNTYTGVTTLTLGTLNIQNAQGTGTTAGGVTIASGAGLQLQSVSGFAVGAEAISSMKGMGVTGGGALENVSGNNTWGGLITLAAASRINSTAGLLTLDVSSGNAITGTFGLTLGGAGNGVIKDPIATSTGTVTKDGAGTWTFSPGVVNTYTGGTLVNNGTLVIDFINAGVATNIINSGSALTLGGGTLSVLGKPAATDSQTFASTTLTAGTYSVLSANKGTATSLTVALQTLTRNINSGLNFDLTGSPTVTLTGTTTANGILTSAANGAAYATFNQADWANVSGNNPVAYTGYATDFATFAATDNENITVSSSIPAAFSVNTLRFNAGGSQNLTLTGVNTLNAGGVLIGSGAGAVTIGGTGLLVGIASGSTTFGELNIFQNSSSATIISAAIGNNPGSVQYSLTGGSTTNSSSTVNVASTAGLSTGMTVFGLNIPAGAFITGITSATAFTISAAVSSTGGATGQTYYVGMPIAPLNKFGSGTLVLSSTANVWAGGVNIGGGTLKLGAANVIPDGASSPGQLNISPGGVLDLAGFNETINGLGGAGIVDNSAATAATLVLGNTNASSTFSGTIQNSGGGALSLIKIGTGTLTLVGLNSYTGSTTINQGTISLNTTTVGASLVNMLPATALTIGSGTLSITGSTIASYQSFTGTTLAGSATVSTTGTTPNVTLNLGAITRNAGTTLSVLVGTSPTGVTTTTTANTGGSILGGWAVQGATVPTTWAVSAGNGTTAGAITGLATFLTTTTAGNTAANYLPASDVDVTSSPTLSAGVTINSLRFNTAAASTLTLTGTNIITTGGILMTNGVGSNNQTISGGTLEGSASGELIVNNYGTSTNKTLTINSIIANNGGATGLTINAGTGIVNLRTATNTFTGATVINSGTLDADAQARISSSLVLNGGIFALDGNYSLTSSLTLGAAGGTLNVIDANGNHVVGSTTAIVFTGSGSRTLTLMGGAGRVFNLPMVIGDGAGGPTSINLSSTSDTTLFRLDAINTYTGNTVITRGVLRLNASNVLYGAGGLLSTATVGNIIFDGNGLTRAILETNASAGTITRSVGYGPGQIHWEGSGGFSNSAAGTVAVNLGGAFAQLTWGVGGFMSNGSTFAAGGNYLEFGQAAANGNQSLGTIDFQNPISLGSLARTILVDGVNVGAANAVLPAVVSGALSSTAGGGLIKSGQGILELTGSNAANTSGATIQLAAQTSTTNAGALVFGSTSAILGSGANITFLTSSLVASAVTNGAVGLVGDTNPIASLGARIANPGTSTGAFLLGADSSAALDFSNYPNMRLAGYSFINTAGVLTNPAHAVNYTGTITPGGGIYRFGGLFINGTTTAPAAALVVGSLLSGANSVDITYGSTNLTNTNTYSGNTVLNGNNVGGNVMVGIGSDAAFGSGTITLAGANTWYTATINGDHSVSNNVFVDGSSTANWEPGPNNTSNGALNNANEGNLTFLGTIDLGSRNNMTLTGRNGKSVLFLGDFTNVTQGFTYSQSATGYLSFLSIAANGGVAKTYTGNTIVSVNGILVIDANSSLGGATGLLSLGSGTSAGTETLQVQPGTASVDLAYVDPTTHARTNRSILIAGGSSSVVVTPNFNVPNGSSLTIGGTITNTNGVAGLIKTGLGTMTLTAQSPNATTTGTLQISAGTLVLDAATAGGTVWGAAGQALILGVASATFGNGGTLEITGTSAQSFGAVTVNPRANTIKLDGAMTLTLGAITRTTGSTLNFTVPTGSVAYTTAGIAGLVNGGTTWGTDDFAGATGSVINQYAGYTTVSASIASSTNANYLVDNSSASSVTMAVSGTTEFNTLKYGGSSNQTIDVGSGNIMRLGAAGTSTVTRAGGILVASGAGTLTIGVLGSAGTLTVGSAATSNSTGDLIFINNSSNAITVNSVIANNGTGATTVVSSGSGQTILAGANTFTGAIIINSGVLEVGSVNVSTVAGPLGQATVGVGNILLNGGTFRANLLADGATNHGFTINAPSTIEVVANTLTLNATLNGLVTANAQVLALNAGNLKKTGAGTLELNDPAPNANNTGLSIEVAQGTLLLNKTTTTTGTLISAVDLDGGAALIIDSAASGSAATVKIAGTGGNQISDVSSVVVKGDNTVKGVLDLNGHNETIDGLAGTGIVKTDVAGTSTLTLGGNNNAGNAAYTLAAAAAGVNSNGLNNFGGTIQDGVGTVAVTKIGSGTQIFSAAQTYSGTTTITAGTLRLAVANALPSGAGKGDVYIAGDQTGTNVGALTNTMSDKVIAPGTLDMGGFNQAINGLNSTTGGYVTNNPTLAWNGSAWDVALASQGTKTLTLGNADANGSFNGVIENGFTVAPGITAIAYVGTVNLVKTGSGTQTLSGANTYGGSTAIQNGSVIVSGGDNRLPTGTTVTLGSGSNSGLLQIGDGSGAFSQQVAGLNTSGSGTSNAVVGGGGQQFHSRLESNRCVHLRGCAWWCWNKSEQSQIHSARRGDAHSEQCWQHSGGNDDGAAGQHADPEQ